MTDEQLRELERDFEKASTAAGGNDCAHRYFVSRAILSLIRERYKARETAAELAARVEGRAAAVDSRLAKIESNQLTAEQREAVVAVVKLGAQAIELADKIGVTVLWFRRVALWLTPLLVFIAAASAARAVFTELYTEIMQGFRK